jgi:subtilase family serine protease
VITTSDSYLGRCYAGTLAAGTEHTCTITYTVPWNQTGTYYIGAIADYSNMEIDETSETNNVIVGDHTIVLTRTTFPDLTATSVTYPSSANTGDVITMTAVVKNIGTGTSYRGSYTGIYLSTDSVITTSDSYLGRCYAGTLAAGAEHTCTITYTIPSTLSGTYYIGAIADYSNMEIDETNEMNNSLAGDPIIITKI